MCGRTGIQLQHSAIIHASWLKLDRPARSVSAHNIHGPRASHAQPCGTAMLLFHDILQYARKPNQDFRKLGRWCSWVFDVNPTHRFRMIVVYNVGRSKPKGLKTVYQQHLSYIQTHDLKVDPRTLFMKDFETQLRT